MALLNELEWSPYTEIEANNWSLELATGGVPELG